MKVFKVAFEFLMGCLAVIMVLMAITMIAYIMKVTIEEIFSKELIEKVKGWLSERLH
jgi:hypothetical protein